MIDAIEWFIVQDARQTRIIKRAIRLLVRAGVCSNSSDALVIVYSGSRQARHNNVTAYARG